MSRQYDFGLVPLLILAVSFTPGCRKGPVKIGEADDLPKTTQRAFVDLGRQMRALHCLDSFDWAHPDQSCQGTLYQTRPQIVETNLSIGNLPADRYPKLAAIRESTTIVAQKLEQVLMAMGSRGDAPSNIVARIKDLARRITSVAEMVEAAFAVNDPYWDDGSTPPAVRPAEAPAPSAPPPPVAAAPPPEAAAPPTAGATPPVVEQEEPVAPKIAPPPTAAELLAAESDLLAILQGTEHNPPQIMGAQATLQKKMNALSLDMGRYREVVRDEAQQAQATRFMGRADRAFGRIQLATRELTQAARRLIEVGDGTSGENVFRNADERLELVVSDLQSVREALPPTP